jgi:hypothetical protein
MKYIAPIRTSRILLAYIASLFICTLTAGPVLDRNSIAAPQPSADAAARRFATPHFAAPIGMDVPEPATYLVVGTVLIGFSIGVHALRRRHVNKVGNITAATGKDTSLRDSDLTGVSSQS